MHRNLVVTIIGIHKAKELSFEAPSTSLSMLGSGYASFRQALFKSVKSTYILHLFRDHDHVSQPSGEADFFDEIDF